LIAIVSESHEEDDGLAKAPDSTPQAKETWMMHQQRKNNWIPKVQPKPLILGQT